MQLLYNLLSVGVQCTSLVSNLAKLTVINKDRSTKDFPFYGNIILKSSQL